MGRTSGRANDALRPITITRRYLRHAHGSCLFELGDTKVLCAATFADSAPGWRRGSGLGWVTAEYSLLPASTHTRSRREVSMGAPSGRTHEIQRLIGRSLRTVVDMRSMGGECTLNLDCDVIQADGGTRCASITGAWVAAALAVRGLLASGAIGRNPIRDHVAAISVGVVGDARLLDLDYVEDSGCGADMNVVMTGAGQFVEVQGTAEGQTFDRKALDGLLDLAETGIRRLVGEQQRALEQAG